MSITAPAGFVAAGHAAGIKASGDLDLSLVATDDGQPVAAAGVFTANLMTAAPVRITRAHLEATGGRAAAVVLSSGNANAATGAAGRADAEAICHGVAEALGCAADEVLICQTGLIGIPLPMDVITPALAPLVAARRPDGDVDAAEAIRTTDTHRKEVVVHAEGFAVGGMAKGAAMLSPNMATMLAVLTTDAAAPDDVLASALREGVAASFNRLSTDGCQSTNDTVLLLASGRAGAVDPAALRAAVAEACTSLARQMAGDAEGATKVVTLRVVGAASASDAELVARAIAESALCKCSWYGCDPYWGRLASEAGACGAAFSEDRLAVSYGGVTVAAGGITIEHDEAAVRSHMAGRELDIEVDLGLGEHAAHLLTNDLTHAYVDENMGTS